MPDSGSWRRGQQGRSGTPETGNHKQRADPEWASPCCLLHSTASPFQHLHKNRFGRSHAPFKVVGQNIQASDRAVKLPKLGWVKAKVSTPVQGRILNATVSMSRSGKFFVSLCCTGVEVPQYSSTGAAVGLDVGIKDLVITSDGQKFDNPKYLQKAEKRLTTLQRRLSRKPKDSRNREKARLRLAKQHEYIANCRQDYLHKLTNWVVSLCR